MSSQVFVAPVGFRNLQRDAGTPSPTASENMHLPQALDTTFARHHSLSEESNTKSSLLSHQPTDSLDIHISQPCDQATFEETQRAVGNLLDALRTNDGRSQTTQDAIGQPPGGPSERINSEQEVQRPSISPLEPRSPEIPAHAITGFTFAGVQPLHDSVGNMPADGLFAGIDDASTPPAHLFFPAGTQAQAPQEINMLQEEVAETVEEELPLNVQNAQDTGQISAFAKLEFDDGPFYITTYSLELGRDARAYRAAKARLAALQAPQSGGKSPTGTSHPSSQNKREGGSQVKGSVVSDRGGFYGVDDIEGEAQEADEERERQKAHGSHASNQSASSIVNPKDLHTQPPLPHFNYQAYPIETYEREIEEIPAPVTSEHLPEQEEGFLLPIHHAPVKDNLEQDVANHRSVSRRHAKIIWEDDCFRFHVKGVNGAFVNEIHYPKDAIVPLREDVSIQIKGIKFQFKLPVHNSIESSEESDQVEDDSPNQHAEASSATSSIERTVTPNFSSKTSLKLKIRNFKQAFPPPSQPVLGPDGKPKRRGPGRPPKDGIMSKRERTAKERADREAAAKAANGGVTPEPSNQGRSGRPTPKNATEAEDSKPAKRKYTKRKSANQDPDDVTPKLEHDSDGAVDDAPPAKRARINRSESPEYPKLEDLSEKDLQRPPYNYSILIYDLLKDSPKPLDLKGIYRGLKMKWPHFLYRYKDAKGWESSVRHNVNEDKLKIIEKVDRVGKGFSYRAKPGVDIEQHKKKRARSPPAAPKMPPPPQHKYQQQPQQPPARPYTYPQGHQPPPGQSMYGHLVPTTVPPSSMSSAASYRGANQGPVSSGTVPGAPRHATSGPSLQPMAHSVTMGPQPAPASANTGLHAPHAIVYPTPPTPSQPRPGSFNNPPPQQPAPPANSTTPDHVNQQRKPHPPASVLNPPSNQTLPPGVSPFQPFLPTGLSVISTFESSLLDGVENSTDLARIRATLASVRKRVFEGAGASSLPGGETQDERTFLHYFRHILENETFRNPGFVGWEAVRWEKERLKRVQRDQVQEPMATVTAVAMAGESVPPPPPPHANSGGVIEAQAPPSNAAGRVIGGSNDSREGEDGHGNGNGNRNGNGHGKKEDQGIVAVAGVEESDPKADKDENALREQ